jgi:1,5-anhydro-D-fructose reductase (1,5-anhydro-D-mannitol-forming)
MEHPASVRWGLIGTSGFADTIFAPALQQAGQTLVGAAGSSPEHSDAFAARHGCPGVYGAVEDLLADPDVDAVWVASPNYLHEPHIAAALTHGKHVLAEKPLATTGADADSLARLAESTDRRLGVGYQARFHPALRDLREHVRDGGVGKVAFVRSSWQTQYPALPREWRLQRETSGGWSIMDIGTHGLDAALWLTGFPEAHLLAASLSTHHWPVEVDDQALLLLDLGGARAIVEAATGVRGPINRVEVYGTGGWAIATGTYVDRLGPAGGSLATSSGIERSYDEAANPYEAQAVAFAAWTRGHTYPGATAHDGARNVAVLESARDWVPQSGPSQP